MEKFIKRPLYQRAERCLLAVLLLVMSISVAAQVPSKETLSFECKNESLASAFQRLERASGYKILFTYEDVQSYRATVSMKNRLVTAIMDALLSGHPLAYRVEGKYITVTPGDKKQEKGTRRQLQGNVTDRQGEPLIGASVRLSGTSQGTMTDVNGSFQLSIPEDCSYIEVSYIGMKPQRVSIDKKDFVRVTLEEDSQMLNDFVVTGIFKKQESVFTGSALTITKKELDQFGDKNLVNSLANIDPAFHIVANNDYGSDPNRLPDLQVRGTTSITAVQDGSDAMLNYPLIIMDGFEISLRRMLDLNPEEVESVTLLKDGAATAIYGSRGANGIIVITSREPEEGRLRLTYNGHANVEVPDLTGYHLLDARRKLELEKSMGYFDGTTPDEIVALSNRYASILADVERGVDTDWLAKPLHTGIGHRHALRIEGGD